MITAGEEPEISEIEKLKEEKKDKINEVDFVSKDLSGKTTSSIKKAKEKLKELKESAIKLVNEAKSIEEVNNIALPSIDEAKALLKEKTENGGGSSGGTSQEKGKTYTVAVNMERYADGGVSMANNAIDHTAKIIEKGGERKVQMVFKPLKFMGREGHLIGMTVGGKAVKVVDRYSDGNIKTVEFNVDGKPNKVLATVEVDAMNEINGGKVIMLFIAV